MSDELHHPPLTCNRDGGTRRVGIEIEFAGLDALQAAGCVRALFGGRIVERDPYHFVVEDSCFGDFDCKLDSHHAHATEEDSRSLKDLLFGLVDDRQAQDLVRKAGSLIGDVSRYWLPVEVVGPPVPYTEVPAFDRLALALADAGAQGTQESLIYGFGLQLNPEVASVEADYLRRHIQAYCLASEWLRATIDIDMTRRLLPFVDRFPTAYLRLVLNLAYAPDLGRLMDDFLAHNPTRNRELDLLPLFRLLDEERLRAIEGLDLTLVKARPTFHYRLPNASLGVRGWSILREWNRWVTVERLAADGERLETMMKAWRANDAKLLSDDWALLSARWLESGGS